MMFSVLRSVRATAAVAATAIVVSVATPAPALRAQSTIPARLSDKDFWQLATSVSEPGGTFRSENFLSNETGFQYVIPGLKQTHKPGAGVYLGVGPEQNFTYVVALQPSMAIIFDIRRQNMMLHLMYKALVEMSADRADFLSRLFSRPRPRGLDSASTAAQLFESYAAVKSDSASFRRNLAAIKQWLTVRHGFALADSDMQSLEHVYVVFNDFGPDIDYSAPYGSGARGMPSYSDLQSRTDDGNGHNLAYLATELGYRWLRDFESRNLLVPVVGDFAGPKAIRTAGKYLKDHHATVGTFYLSNVEQYLFQDPNHWKEFYRNVETLPIDATSTFIRSIGGRGRFGAIGRAPLSQTFSGGGQSASPLGGRLPSVVCSIQELLEAFNDGRILHYDHVIDMSK
jgi:hypothetical protein